MSFKFNMEDTWGLRSISIPSLQCPPSGGGGNLDIRDLLQCACDGGGRKTEPSTWHSAGAHMKSYHIILDFTERGSLPSEMTDSLKLRGLVLRTFGGNMVSG